MNHPDEQLAHALRMKFKTSYEEPNEEQLSKIKAYVLLIQRSGKIATTNDWSNAVNLYCPSAGTHKYAGVDNSDLNTLLALAAKATEGK